MSGRPVLVAVAHGTRAPAGPRVLEELLDEVRGHLDGVDARLAYVDVIEPTLAATLAEVGGPCVVVPLFLASGYHVRVDVPGAVRTTGADAAVTDALGSDPAVVEAVADRMWAAGPLPDAVVLAAAGSSDTRALGEVEAAGAGLAELLARPVVPAYVTTAEPGVPEAVAALRRSGRQRVGIASYLLAPGLFQRRLAEAGADFVAEPIGVHPAIVELIVRRYRDQLA